jgi:hypothetical protein
MIGLHDHHRGHSTRVARTIEKTFALFSPGHYSQTPLGLKSFNYFRHQFSASWDAPRLTSADGRVSQTRQTK